MRGCNRFRQTPCATRVGVTCTWDGRFLFFQSFSSLVSSYYMGDVQGLAFGSSCMNVCLYASFLIFESVVAYDGQPVSKQVAWEVGGDYLAFIPGRHCSRPTF